MAEQLPGTQPNLTLKHPTDSSQVSIAVIHTEQEASAKEYVVVLQNNGIQAVQIQCKTPVYFTTIDFTPFDRIYLLVDEAMCAILMTDEGLDKDVFPVFEEMGKCNKVLHVINHLVPGNDMFYNFIPQIPRGVRIVFKEYQSTKHYLCRDAAEQGRIIQETTGMTGGSATDSNIIGALHIENSPRDQLQICINFADEIKGKLTENVQSNISSSDGVLKVDITFGSIVITLTLEDGFVVTEKWIRGILKSLFNENLASCISEGDTFSVVVQRHLIIQGTDLPCLYGMLNKYRQHENYIPREEHDTRIGSLQSEIKELRDEIKRIKEEQMTEAKVMLLYKHRTFEEEDGTSGIHSADDSVSEPVADTETGRRKGEEETLPVGFNKWDIEEGDMKLIISSRNAMFNEACRRGKMDIVKGIISAGGVDINNRSEKGLTPVMIAAWNGHKQLFDFLVEKGCDLSVMLDNGNNILHVSCIGGNVGIVDFIITSSTVDNESKGMYGGTAVMKAALVGQKKVFDLLVSKGCDLSGVDDTGNNILHLACYSDSVDIVQYLITHNTADINSKGNHGRTPVMIAAEKGLKKVFDLLVSMGSDLSGVDDTGNTILHVACLNDNADIVQYIITHNIADINSKGNHGRTPVMVAAEKGQKKVFDLLVSMGSDLSAWDDGGASILHLAAMGGNVDVVEHILTEQTVDINRRDNRNWTPLQYARYKKHERAVSLLIARGAVEG